MGISLWRGAAISYAVIMAVWVVGYAIVSAGAVAKTAAGVLLWWLLVAGGVAAIAFPLEGIINFTPYCEPSATVAGGAVCAWFGGAGWGWFGWAEWGRR